jgi:hypothetical protein
VEQFTIKKKNFVKVRRGDPDARRKTTDNISFLVVVEKLCVVSGDFFGLQSFIAPALVFDKKTLGQTAGKTQGLDWYQERFESLVLTESMHPILF